MKQTFRFLSIGLMLIGLMMTQSCDKCKDVECQNGGTCEDGTCTCPAGFSGTNCETEDKCVSQNVTCQNGGTCSDGVCTCASGYEGTTCATKMQTKFVGQFQGNETCTVGSDSYILTVAASTTDILKITLSNVYNQGFIASATVNASAFTVASQTVSAGVTVSGSGTISGNSLTFSYTISSTSTNSCTFVGTKL